MNKVLLIGRLVRDPETNTTTSGIKYSRITIAVNRPFGDDQADFIPVVAWRNQAEFIEKYMTKGALVSVDGRFTSSTYNNAENQTVTRYEVTADRIEALESKAQSAQRNSDVVQNNNSQAEVTFQKEEVKTEEANNQDVPWDLDL